MFTGKKPPTPPIVKEVAAKLEQMAKPSRRPYFEAFQAQRRHVEAQLDAALKNVEELTVLLQSYRYDEMLLSMNPDMDRIFERLSNGKTGGA
jgi:hypothetical protein